MKLFFRTLFVCSPLLAGLFWAGCGSTSIDPMFSDGPQPFAANGGNARVNKIDPTVARFRVGDTILVTLSGLPEAIPPHEEAIKEDGQITLPLIGSVPAVGKTAGELQNEIYNLYVPKYYQRVNVTVKSPQDRVYYIGGEVRAPGRQLYVGTTSVTKAIQSAGDFTDFAKKTDVSLIRANGERIKVNCNKALEDPTKDPLVYPGDQIQVPRRYW
jgi:polysaccharide export outer membrane protein